MGRAVDTLSLFLAAARRMGMRAVPLMGAYDDLTTVALPVVVCLSAPSSRHAVEASLEHAGARRTTLSRDTFCELWTSDVIVAERDDEAVAEALEALSRRRAVTPITILATATAALATLAATALLGLVGPDKTIAGSEVVARAAIAPPRWPVALPLAWLGTGLYGVLFGVMLAVSESTGPARGLLVVR